MKNLTVCFTYVKGDTFDITEDRVEELYNECLNSNPSATKDEVLDHIRQSLIEDVQEKALYELDGEDCELCDYYELTQYIESYIEEHWNETEHSYEDREGQLHLFDPNEC